MVGKYNITGNETCDSTRGEKLDTCQFKYDHYFLDAMEWTLLMIISNDVSTEVHPIALNIVKGKF